MLVYSNPNNYILWNQTNLLCWLCFLNIFLTERCITALRCALQVCFTQTQILYSQLSLYFMSSIFSVPISVALCTSFTDSIKFPTLTLQYLYTTSLCELTNTWSRASAKVPNVSYPSDNLTHSFIHKTLWKKLLRDSSVFLFEGELNEVLVSDKCDKWKKKKYFLDTFMMRRNKTQQTKRERGGTFGLTGEQDRSKVTWWSDL